MNKPDWKDAPEWAQYLAMDADGKWYWYEKQPILVRGRWTRAKWTAPATLESRP